MRSLENDRHSELAAIALHDSIVRVPGGSRITSSGHPIKPMDPKLAGQTFGKSADEIRNQAAPSKHDHRFYADQVHDLLMEGMDPAWLDAVERSIGRVAIQLPDVSAHGDLAAELMKSIQEFGDIGRTLSDALVDGRISAKEFAYFELQIDEALGAIIELGEAVRLDVS